MQNCDYKSFYSFHSIPIMLLPVVSVLVPNTREALSLLVQHYSVPKDFERSILSEENPRVCNQGILNYLLIVLRSDKNFGKFWKTLKAMIKEPVLRRVVEEIQRGVYNFVNINN